MYGETYCESWKEKQDVMLKDFRDWNKTCQVYLIGWLGALHMFKDVGKVVDWPANDLVQ